MNQPLYTLDILRLAAAIPHLGRLEQADGIASLRAPTCGSRMTVEVRLDGEGRVEAIGQSVEACAFGQASAALMGQSAIGRGRDEIEAALAELEDWLAGRREDAGSWPGLDVLRPARSRTGRHGAIVLPFRALLAAVDQAKESKQHG